MLTKKDLNTKEEYDRVARLSPYYTENRWRWFEEAMNMLIGVEAESVLEIGSYIFPVVKWARTIDIKGTPNTFLDLDFMPWAFEDKQFDLVIALHTLEHLERRKMAFDEMRRVAKSALISLPFEWDTPDDHLHHNITREKINEWTSGEVPVKEFIGGDANKKQIILYYQFK
jgi:hypothetical protein